VGELERHLLRSATTRKVEKVTPSQDDDFVGVFEEKHPKQVSAYGLASWATLNDSQPSLRDLVWKQSSHAGSSVRTYQPYIGAKNFGALGKPCLLRPETFLQTRKRISR
jgi:hypothetical protein